MRTAVIQFPGSNCNRDMAVALDATLGRVSPPSKPVQMVWHKESSLPDGLDLLVIPGGFSFGDYLRCGAIAAHAPIMRSVKAFADKGGYVLGVCNGFQILTESRILPGALVRNAGLKFVCKSARLQVATVDSVFTAGFSAGAELSLPIAHHDGNYTASASVLARLRGDDRIAFRYLDNPNGSVDAIAGVLSANRRVCGMMPHPERLISEDLGGVDGAVLFEALLSSY